MSAADIARAKREAELTRRRLMGTVGELQDRLKPATIASNAWEGVRDRSTDLADEAVQAVKSRPMAASAAVGAVTLFLARSPIKSAFSWLFSRKKDDDLVTTRLDGNNSNFDLTTPVVARQQDEGVNA